MEKRSNTYVMMFCSVAIAVNIVLGIVTSALKIPLYLDTLGTVLAAVLFGPLPGVIVGALTNVVTGLIYDVKDIPFALVNMAVGLVTGLVCRKFRFTLLTAVLLGLALSFICPAIGTPIGIFVYGGLNGSFSDVLVMCRGLCAHRGTVAPGWEEGRWDGLTSVGPFILSDDGSKF